MVLLLMLRFATVEEREKTYEWLCLSDTTAMHMGMPYFPESPIPDKEEFMLCFEDFYYTEKGRDKGAVLIVSENGEDIGCVCYTCFHLREYRAELDIWLKAKKYCGKGYGSGVIKELTSYLKEILNINKFIIRPSEKNIQAIKAHKKAGFKPATDKYKAVKEFLKPEYLNFYGEGDYRVLATAVLTLEL